MQTIRDRRQIEAALTAPAYEAWFHDRFRADAQLVEAQAGEVFLRRGDEAQALYLLLSGRVSIHALLPNGKRRILRTDQAPALLGEMELLERRPFAMSVQALENCRLVRLPFACCREALLGDPVFLRKLAILLGNKERTGIQRLFAAVGYPLPVRLARFILEMREGNLFLVRKAEAADSLGVSYRHLSQVLSTFVQSGYLKKDRFVYTIADEPTLCSLADQTEA